MATKLTITEALADIKTIGARLAKKREAAARYLVRDGKVVDPLATEGGSTEFVKRERQGIKDLQRRLINLRAGIQKANHAETIDVCGRTETVADWLTWRREIAEGEKTFLQQLSRGILAARAEAGKQQRAVVAGADQVKQEEVYVAISEKDLLAEIEHIENVLGTLDGKLSLFNATTTIEIPD